MAAVAAVNEQTLPTPEREATTANRKAALCTLVKCICVILWAGTEWSTLIVYLAPHTMFWSLYSTGDNDTHAGGKRPSAPPDLVDVDVLRVGVKMVHIYAGLFSLAGAFAAFAALLLRPSLRSARDKLVKRLIAPYWAMVIGHLLIITGLALSAVTCSIHNHIGRVVLLIMNIISVMLGIGAAFALVQPAVSNIVQRLHRISPKHSWALLITVGKHVTLVLYVINVIVIQLVFQQPLSAARGLTAHFCVAIAATLSSLIAYVWAHSRYGFLAHTRSTLPLLKDSPSARRRVSAERGESSDNATQESSTTQENSTSTASQVPSTGDVTKVRATYNRREVTPADKPTGKPKPRAPSTSTGTAAGASRSVQMSDTQDERRRRVAKGKKADRAKKAAHSPAQAQAQAAKSKTHDKSPIGSEDMHTAEWPDVEDDPNNEYTLTATGNSDSRTASERPEGKVGPVFGGRSVVTDKMTPMDPAARPADRDNQRAANIGARPRLGRIFRLARYECVLIVVTQAISFSVHPAVTSLAGTSGEAAGTSLWSHLYTSVMCYLLWTVFVAVGQLTGSLFSYPAHGSTLLIAFQMARVPVACLLCVCRMRPGVRRDSVAWVENDYVFAVAVLALALSHGHAQQLVLRYGMSNTSVRIDKVPHAKAAQYVLHLCSAVGAVAGAVLSLLIVAYGL